MIKQNILLLSVFLLLAECGDNRNGDNGKSEQQKLTLEVVQVTRGILIERIQSSGVVQGIKEVLVTSKTQGTIEEVSFEIGDLLTRGDILVKVDNAEAAYSLKQERQALNAARLNLNAIRKLYNQGASSDAELANALSAYNSAQAKFEAAREENANTRISAPIRGYVATKESAITVGNNLNLGTPVARIVDLSRIRVEIPLGESDIRKVNTGDTVHIVPFAKCPKDSQFSGNIQAIAAGANPATGSFTVVITADNPCGIALKSGMTVTVVIEISKGDSAFIIPTSAIINNNKVFIFLDGKVRQHKIVHGETVGNRTEVISGLDSGMVVVITPPPGLTTGTEVDTALLGKSAEWQ